MDRRQAIAATASLALAGRATAQADPDTAEAALRRAFTTDPAGRLDVEARIGFLAENAVVVADDAPFLLDRAAYADHLRFERDLWDGLEIIFSDVHAVTEGETTVVSGFYNLRGKPKDAGFRLRPGYCTAVCTRTAAGWRAVALHMAPLTAQLLDASPS